VIGGNAVKMQNLKTGQKGVAALEFAIILPFLVLLTFGIIEFSILFYNKAMVTNASREGARAGIVFADPRADDAYIKTKVKTYCANYLITFGASAGTPLGDGDINIVPAEPRDGLPAGTPLTVTVTYHYDFLVLPNFIGYFLGGMDLSAVTVMRME